MDSCRSPRRLPRLHASTLEWPLGLALGSCVEKAAHLYSPGAALATVSWFSMNSLRVCNVLSVALPIYAVDMLALRRARTGNWDCTTRTLHMASAITL